MNLDTSSIRMIEGFNACLQRHHNRAHQDMNKTYQASCAPTNDFIIRKAQALFNRFFDSRHNCKSCQVGLLRWFVWDFDRFMDEEKELDVCWNIILAPAKLGTIHELVATHDLVWPATGTRQHNSNNKH